jgi:hypothetical protein
MNNIRGYHIHMVGAVSDAEKNETVALNLSYSWFFGGGN